MGLHASIKNMSNELAKQNNRNRNLFGVNTAYLLKLNHVSAPQVTGSLLPATSQLMVFRWGLHPPSLYWLALENAAGLHSP